MWPVRETIRKCARTFSNVAALADAYPDLRFACSSAQQYAWVQEHHPHVFARIKEKVASGQFVPVGGMWVESDTNLPGGEALARQLVQGRRYFARELGVEEQPEVWLPDSFGYTGAFPQLARLAGARWFLSQKMSWNTTNRFPHHTFWWEGIDGSRVFTHFPPADTYGSKLSGEQLAYGVANFADAGPANRSLLPFGYGDGGGGPTREMMETARRVADLEGSPRVVVETPAEFFAGAEAEYPQAPVWSGEMYLEFHRGTYTSQLAMKQGNRRTEHLLREAELWGATAAVRAGADYPYDHLDRLWQDTLLLQFHDILPGSSIAWVHREARDTYRRLAGELEALVAGSLAAAAGSGEVEVLANAAPHDRDGVPALAAGTPAAPGAPVTVARDGDAVVLDNGLLRVRVDADGTIGSVRDLVADREVLAPGAAPVDVRDAWVRATVPGQGGTGAFMTLQAPAGARLVGVATPAAGVAEVHEMKMEGGTMRMRAIPALELPPHQSVALSPGGYHVMLMDLKGPLAAGRTIPLTLRFEDAAGVRTERTLQVEVRQAAPGGAHAPAHRHD